MGLSGKVSAEVELKSPADKYYKVWRSETHKMPDITSTRIQGIKLHEGNWDTHGSVKVWDYTIGMYHNTVLVALLPYNNNNNITKDQWRSSSFFLFFFFIFIVDTDGKKEIFKEKVLFDDANLSFELHGVEGHMFDYYKVFKPTCKLIPKARGSLAKLTIEYEKYEEGGPIPDNYMTFFSGLIKDTDDHVYGSSSK